MLKRIFRLYLIIGKNFNVWFSTILTGLILIILRTIVAIGKLLDLVLFWSMRYPLKDPIIIVGNPRSGTTFLHRFLIDQNIGSGSELWQMLYPSIFVQKIIKPLLPIMEKISPARHHSTKAHETSLTSVETDDVSLLFRYLDGFFFYGFFLTFDDEDLFHWIDPDIRDTSKRDFDWFESMWKRNMITNKGHRYIGKLFSLSSNLPNFQKRFKDAKVLYMIRDPLSVIPSGLSLVTGVLEKRFGFWSLDEETKKKSINRLYLALVELLKRFQRDWGNNTIDRDRVMIIRFDDMMTDFESLMHNIINFLDLENTDHLKKAIKKTAEKQRQYIKKII